MQIQIPPADLKSVLASIFSTAMSAEQQLSASAQAQVEALAEELYPLVVSETESLAASANPAIPQAYLGVLQGCVAAAIAKLGLQSLETQRDIIAATLQTGIQVLALVVKAAVV